MAIHPRVTADMRNSRPMAGTATFSEAPMKGVKNAATEARTRTIRLSPGGISCGMAFLSADDEADDPSENGCGEKPRQKGARRPEGPPGGGRPN